MTPEQKEGRLAMIKRIAERQAKLKEIKASSRKAMLKTIDAEPINGLHADVAIVDDSLNINHWTDAPQYANEFYGEVMRETTRFDNDWD